MIETALKDRAPKTYRELKLRGKLQEFLQNHEQAMMESYDQERIRAMETVGNPTEKKPVSGKRPRRGASSGVGRNARGVAGVQRLGQNP